MSYLAFHLVFILPPIALLAWGARGRLEAIHPRAVLFLPLLSTIALLYTTPWDNYLIWRGVWAYGPDRVVGTIGYVPVEEYLFFLLQPLLTGLWLYRVIGNREQTVGNRAQGTGNRGPDSVRFPVTCSPFPSRARWAGALLYLVLAVAGALLLRHERGTYLGLILAWAAPVLGLQWAYAGGEIWRRRGAFLHGVSVPTVYLWIADALAIRWGIWSISEPLTTGLSLLGLPLEEAVFFLVTNLLVVQGLMLFVYPPAGSALPAVGRRLSAVGQPGRQPTADSR